MGTTILERIFEHNHWANSLVIQACSLLSDEQLDAKPSSATKGTIRQTLAHLVNSEHNYLSDLIDPKARFDWQAPPSFAELQQVALTTGEKFLALVKDTSNASLQAQIHTDDGYTIEPWVIVLQAINHATEHREQIKSMLTALGITPPRIDGWMYGRLLKALVPPAHV